MDKVTKNWLLVLAGFVGFKAYQKHFGEVEPAELGQVTSISYLADKGDGQSEYVHYFDSPRPQLEEQDDGDLVLEGGTYAVVDDWIEG